VLDGEVCVFDKDLVSQFHLLERSVSEEPCTPPVFMAFDCLHVHGLDVRGLSLHRRRHMLEQEIAGPSMIYAARRLPEKGLAGLAVVKERGYEGLVAKDAESTYRAGLTRSWLKVKVRREGRFVLGGIFGLPHTFAGILVGQRLGGRLLYRGTVEWGIGLRAAKELLRRGHERRASLCLPLICPIGLRRPAADIRDVGRPRGAPSPPYPGSVAARCALGVHL
jgi:bifunctional non-homologous end joining protein LigD